jgi:hypothetical protein
MQPMFQSEQPTSAEVLTHYFTQVVPKQAYNELGIVIAHSDVDKVKGISVQNGVANIANRRMFVRIPVPKEVSDGVYVGSKREGYEGFEKLGQLSRWDGLYNPLTVAFDVLETVKELGSHPVPAEAIADLLSWVSVAISQGARFVGIKGNSLFANPYATEVKMQSMGYPFNFPSEISGTYSAHCLLSALRFATTLESVFILRKTDSRRLMPLFIGRDFDTCAILMDEGNWKNVY